MSSADKQHPNQEQLERAMRTAVRVGLLPKMVDMPTYLHRWEAMRAVLEEFAQDYLGPEQEES